MLQDPLFLVAVNVSVAVFVRILRPNALTAGVLVVVLIVSTTYLGTRHGSEVVGAVYRGRDIALNTISGPPTWPPEKYRTYPNLELIDQEGRVTRLSDFRGDVILIEPVGMSCQACVAFSGGHQRGAFDGTPPQSDLESIDTYARDYGQIGMDDPRIVHVQIVLFNKNMEAPSEEEVRAWAKHFGMDRDENEIVLAGTPSMVSQASRDLVPGFQLVDKNFMLRADSTGSAPQDDLYTDLLPMIQQLLGEN